MPDGSLKFGKLTTVRTVRLQAVAIAIAENSYPFSMESLRASSITFCP